ncbi:MAG: hypothetical protein OER97_05495 [Gammaproteobacteria bacterium]|nr:hypothetical protein [Gammaproteobacteria bacterium]
MSLNTALQDFYREHGFGDVLGARPKTVRVYTGCLLVPLPNIETRYRYLKYHDLHHLVTGYSVGRIGEGQISAWELGTGSMRKSPILGLMNLIALSTGWVLDRQKMWAAFCRGRRSRNLYSAKRRSQVDDGTWSTIDELRADTLDCEPNTSIRRRDRIIYFSYVVLSLGIHASIAIPAMIVRTISDLSQGKSVRKVIQPSPRTDLF